MENQSLLIRQGFFNPLSMILVSILVLLSNPFYAQQVWNQSAPFPKDPVDRSGNVSIGNLINPTLGKFVVNFNPDPPDGWSGWGAVVHSNAGGAQLLRLKGGYPLGLQPVFQVEANNFSGSNYIEDNIRFVILPNGHVGIGTSTPDASLEVFDGDVVVKGGELKVKSAGGVDQFKVRNDGYVWARRLEVLPNGVPIPDYVFNPDYDLMSLTDLEIFIKKNQHLPGIKSAKAYEEKGRIDVGELQLQLLEKVEELSLHIIELNKEIENLKNQIKE